MAEMDRPIMTGPEGEPLSNTPPPRVRPIVDPEGWTCGNCGASMQGMEVSCRYCGDTVWVRPRLNLEQSYDHIYCVPCGAEMDMTPDESEFTCPHCGTVVVHQRTIVPTPIRDY